MRGPRLFAAFAISFIARGLYSHTNHKICYSAVSSGGIVLTLPGFAVSECMVLRSIYLGLNPTSVSSFGTEQQDHADRITQACVGDIPSTVHWFCPDTGLGSVAET
jgi:hypothetical protein